MVLIGAWSRTGLNPIPLRCKTPGLWTLAAARITSDFASTEEDMLVIFD